MALILSTDLIELTKIGLSEIYLNEVNAPNQFYPDIFDVEDMKVPLVEYLRMAGFGAIPEWDADGGTVNYDAPIEGDRIGFVAKDYALAWALSHKILRDDLYKKTSADLTQAAGLSTRHTTEQFAANIFNSGFETPINGGLTAVTGGSSTGGDGVTLFNGSHPTLSGGTISNLLTAAALTNSTLATDIGVVRRAVNDRGQPIVYELDALVVPPELEFVAKQFVTATTVALAASTATSNAAIPNPVVGIIPRVIVWPYLTGTSQHFILAAKAQRKLKYFWRERPWYDADKDFETKGVANSIAYACTVGYISHHGVWGNEGV